METVATEERPVCKLIGENGNVFNVIGRVRRALINAGMSERAKEFTARAERSGSYDEVLQLTMKYVEIE